MFEIVVVYDPSQFAMLAVYNVVIGFKIVIRYASIVSLPVYGCVHEILTPPVAES